jgi:hypothetical protein
LLILLCGGASSASAQSVPPALQGWQEWVLHGYEQQTCPMLATPGDGNGRECVWPGRLVLDAGKSGAHFRMQVHVDAESWVALPGSREAWPQDVQVDNGSAVVLDRDGSPALRLAAGDYAVQGDLHWNERPARLHLPAAIALVDLTVDGVAIGQPERDGDSLTLGPTAERQRQADALSLRVFRRLGDGAPPTLHTTIRLHVAGSAREQLLGPVLPQGFIATALGGDLPARLDPDGHLRVQLRPGDWSVELDARGTAPLAKIAFKAPAAPWPQQEIWSYADAPGLRTTRVGGPQPIDPAQADVPPEWRDLPAFVMTDGSALEIQQRARGPGGNTGDQLRLQRELWLDFDGGGMIASDVLTGTLRSADRLDVAAPWILQNANLADATPLLVTRGDKPGTRGVELRRHDIDLRAGLHRDGYGGAQAATGGWSQTLDGVDATLHLPYGYRLLGAPGADRSQDSWIARWNLLDLFVAVVIALLVWRLLGWPWALVALGFVVLSHAEPGAPRWTPALAVALALIARVLPEGSLRKVARAAGVAMLLLAVLATLPFAAMQLRDALHPQLEASGFAWIAQQPTGAMAPVRESIPAPPAARRSPGAPPPQEQSIMSAPAEPPPPPAKAAPDQQTLQSVVVTGSRIQAADVIGESGYPSNVVVQSGRGTPDWSGYGSAYRLGWSGPVTAQQTWRLVILPAWATRILRVVMLGLLLAWLAAIARSFDLNAKLPGRAGRSAAGVAGLLLLALLAPPARAQSTPSPQLLSELRTRLLEAPQCAPRCAASPLAQVGLRQGLLQVVLEADAGARVAFPLPHADAPAALRSVALDGKPAAELASRDGGVWIALDRGVHRIAMEFQLSAGGDSVALRFPMPPPNVQVSAPGWEIAGVDGSRLLSDTLTFTRERTAATTASARPSAQAFPPYVKLTRNLALGLDSRVDNVVARVSPADGGFTVDLPLLPGEHVGNPGLKAQDGHVQVTFAPGQTEAGWSSTLDVGSALALHAPAWRERAEVWRVASAPLLHLGFSGVPESVGDNDAHVFRPLPGETLQVRVTRPAAVPGDSIAFDRVVLDVARGEHALESTLTLATRSTRGGEQGIDLPRDAHLLGARRDGQTLELNLRDGHVALPVQPGTQTFVLRFRETSALGMLSGTPTVALGAHAANIRTSMALPHDRWVLWTWGPQAGPAVLYWSQLAVLLLAAIALARFAPTPLRWWQWLLLGLGFSSVAWSAYVVVVAWLIVLGLRARSERMLALTHTPFNTLQVLIAVLTVIALLCLVASVPQGLLGQPDMRIAGGNSGAWSLHWFADQSSGALPGAGAFTLPLWCYKLAMLAWALWLANALIGWLRWGFNAWMRGGYWRSSPSSPAPAPAARIAAEGDDART